MSLDIKTIDGLHVLGEKLSGKSKTEKNCQFILKHIKCLIEKTSKKAPTRRSDFKLIRSTMGNTGKRYEAILERCLWKLYKDGGFLENCPKLQSYQVPLKKTQANRGWGKIDLLGVSKRNLPVVIELKTGEAKDTPLRVIVEALSYGIALRKVWEDKKSNFRSEWEKAIQANALPELKKVQLIGLAPKEWFEKRELNEWKSIDKLLTELEKHGFSFKFVSLEKTEYRIPPLS